VVGSEATGNPVTEGVADDVDAMTAHVGSVGRIGPGGRVELSDAAGYIGGYSVETVSGPRRSIARRVSIARRRTDPGEIQGDHPVTRSAQVVCQAVEVRGGPAE